MKILSSAFVLTILLLSSCGEDKKEVEEVHLDTFKDKLSYTLGADHARAISESGDKNFDKYNIDELVKGFKEGLKNEKAFDEDCKNTLKQLFGPNGTGFEKKYADDGSNCLGKLSGMFFYTGWKQKRAFDKIDLAKVIIGFEHGLRKSDTLIGREDQATMIQDFMADINKSNGIYMLEEAKKKNNVVVTASGIVLETLQKGTGGNPATGDDVLAQYILMNSLGDTLQDSYKMTQLYNQPLSPFSLTIAVAGWQEGIPMMNKGGKYRLYIPFHLAYGDQGMFNPQTQTYDIQPYESLMFYIELLDYGKPGSLAKK